ncbi:MAG: hypothetical protein RIQ56_1016 [Candidatus Parcubacteria bacterium]
MSETNKEQETMLRIYEAGYQISPTVQEANLEQVVAEVRAVVEKAGGTFIAEGAPALMKLAYQMPAMEAGKRVEYDRAYFGWLKFESTLEAADAVKSSLEKNPVILRAIVFGTVREETRAKLKAPQLKEVKRGEALKSATRKPEEAAAPVSEVDLDKALSDITE